MRVEGRRWGNVVKKRGARWPSTAAVKHRPRRKPATSAAAAHCQPPLSPPPTRHSQDAR
jgi:hypothetical protein